MIDSESVALIAEPTVLLGVWVPGAPGIYPANLQKPLKPFGAEECFAPLICLMQPRVEITQQQCLTDLVHVEC